MRSAIFETGLNRMPKMIWGCVGLRQWRSSQKPQLIAWQSIINLIKESTSKIFLKCLLEVMQWPGKVLTILSFGLEQWWHVIGCQQAKTHVEDFWHGLHGMHMDGSIPNTHFWRVCHLAWLYRVTNVTWTKMRLHSPSDILSGHAGWL
jgi:hypothetical protein